MLDRQSETDAWSAFAFLDGSVSIGSDQHALERPRQKPVPVRRVALTDLAAQVMTDFTLNPPVTVAADRLIDDALRDMIVAGVRAQLVMHDELIVGLITSYDIQGERPLQFLTASSLTRHDELEVRHIMTPWDRVPTIDIPWVASATVADAVRRFQKLDASHILAIEYAEQGGEFVRGMFSRTQLERQSGQTL